MSRRLLLAGSLLAALAAPLAPARAQPSATAAPPPPRSLGLLSAAFTVTDLDRSLAFYTKGLGLTAPARIENPKATEAPLLFPGGGPSLLLIRSKAAAPADAAPPRIGRIILDVADLRGLAARLQAAGYALASPVVENPQHHVLVAVVKDPDGNELELVQRPH